MYTATSKIRDICNNLKLKIGNKDFLLIKPAMEKSQEKELILKINHFFKKFNELREYVNKEKKLVTTKPMKQAFIQLTNEQSTDDQTSLLNLRPNFVTTNKKTTFIDIIAATKSAVLDLENRNKEIDAESLRQRKSYLFSKKLNFKLKGNLL